MESLIDTENAYGTCSQNTVKFEEQRKFIYKAVS